MRTYDFHAHLDENAEYDGIREKIYFENAERILK